MGVCKDELTPSKKDEGVSIFPKRKKKDSAREDIPRKFADNILKAHERIEVLIIEKSRDLAGGKDPADVKKMALLELMRFHLDSIMDAAEEYHGG